VRASQGGRSGRKTGKPLESQGGRGPGGRDWASGLEAVLQGGNRRFSRSETPLLGPLAGTPNRVAYLAGGGHLGHSMRWKCWLNNLLVLQWRHRSSAKNLSTSSLECTAAYRSRLSQIISYLVRLGGAPGPGPLAPDPLAPCSTSLARPWRPLKGGGGGRLWRP